MASDVRRVNEDLDPPYNRECRGSTYEVGCRFQSCRINDLEMVDQTGIVPVRRAEGDADLPVGTH
jgi:hypothetical protein